MKTVEELKNRVVILESKGEKEKPLPPWKEKNKPMIHFVPSKASLRSQDGKKSSAIKDESAGGTWGSDANSSWKGSSWDWNETDKRDWASSSSWKTSAYEHDWDAKFSGKWEESGHHKWAPSKYFYGNMIRSVVKGSAVYQKKATGAYTRSKGLVTKDKVYTQKGRTKEEDRGEETSTRRRKEDQRINKDARELQW